MKILTQEVIISWLARLDTANAAYQAVIDSDSVNDFNIWHKAFAARASLSVLREQLLDLAVDSLEVSLKKNIEQSLAAW